MSKSFFVYIIASRREKQIKKWERAWKIELIEAGKPEWRDLYETLGPS